MISSLRLKRAAVLAAAFCLLGLLSHARAAFTEQGATILGGANFSSRSASLADIDNDGDLDVMFQHSNGVSLYRNNFYSPTSSSFTFTSITTSTLPSSGINAAWSAAWADYNGDGFVDVFVGQANSGSTSSGTNAGDVLKNNGKAASGFSNPFTNVSSTVGLNDPGFHQNVAWADMNNDRRLDLVIGMEGPERHQIYLQNASGNFSPVGAAAGFQVDYGTKSYGMAIGDTDDDGDLDVYISTCISSDDIRNNFFRNNLVESGTNTLTFTDIADTNGTQYAVNSYGAEFVDLDNDRDLDLLVTGADGNRTKIFRNDGGNMFKDVDSLPSRGGAPLLASNGIDLNGAKPIDYDNDGDLDLYFHDNLSSSGNQVLYRNDGNWQFTDVTATMGLNIAAGGAPVGAGAYDSVWGDLDRDGDQDLIDPNNQSFVPPSGPQVSTPERVYVNDASTNGNKWLYIDLKGPSWNTTGLGSSVFATINSGTPEEVTLRREANTNPNTFNQSDLPVHFGLGAASVVDELLIQWPDGTKQVLLNVAANQYLPVEYMPGDYTGDGIVDSSDYVIWRKGMGTTFNSNDYSVWRSHLGQSIGSGSSPAVPEPTAITLVLAAASGAVIRRRAR